MKKWDFDEDLGGTFATDLTDDQRNTVDKTA